MSRFGKIAERHRIVYLPPMSGLADREHRKEPGEILFLIGQGQTAQVLRNLCWQLHQKDDEGWQTLCRQMNTLFGIHLNDPVYQPARAELTLSYREPSGLELDIDASGRGCQQVLLLLSYMLANPGALLLLDEPDAHLEILRQREIYSVMTELADQSGSQIVAASHSEVILQEAGDRDVLVSFAGRPHRIDTQQAKAQLRKALESISFADYYMVEASGWVIYLEGATDLAILRELSLRLEHPARRHLSTAAPVHYLGTNRPGNAREHFFGLREAMPGLPGIAVFDRLSARLETDSPLVERQWSKREIENHVTSPASIRAMVVEGLARDDLIDAEESHHRIELIDQCCAALERSLALLRRPSPWGDDIKVTDDFLDPLFEEFHKCLGTPQRTFKRDYHRLARVMPLGDISTEVTDMLDAIDEAAQRAIAR